MARLYSCGMKALFDINAKTERNGQPLAHVIAAVEMLRTRNQCLLVRSWLFGHVPGVDGYVRCQRLND